MREDWIELELGEVLKTTSGGTPSRSNSNYYIGSIPWVKSGELNQNTIFKTEEHISEEAVINSSAKIFPKGTLLIALYGATIGKLAFLGIDAATNQAVCGIFENEAVESRFLYYYLFHNRRKLIEQGTGGAQPNISQTILKKLPIVIAPLPEQRAIVARIEELFSELDHSISNLKTAQAKLEIYRQAVLKKAFEGGFTTEKRNLNEEVGTVDHSVGLISIPLNWTLKKISSKAIKVTDGEHITPKRTSSGFLLLSARNIQNGYLSLGNVDHIPESEYLRIIKRCHPEQGDILISCSGSIGRICSVPKNIEFTLVRSVALIKMNWIENSSKFFEYQFQSPFLQKQIEKGKKATAQANLFLGPIKNLDILDCDKEIQDRVVQEIESRLSVADKMAETIRTSLQKAEALRQSILKKAFEGKLLTKAEVEACRNEADWEPAEKLLARIERSRNERVKTEKRKPIKS
jgi:type I restriction enzyme, S subunit